MTIKKAFQIFGILNITPDSFSDGGKFFDPKDAMTQAKKLREEGADILDIGAESTRPGAAIITPAEELDRLELVLNHFSQIESIKLSLDTKNASTAKFFLNLGGSIINDVSGCQDPHMRETIAKYDATVVVNHFPGKTIAEVHTKHIDSVNQVEDELLARREQLISDGVKPQHIILDPGIGFGKTMDLNWELLDFPARIPEISVLIGHSKKRFLGENRYEKDINVKAGLRAIKAGAAYLRVHDPLWYN